MTRYLVLVLALIFATPARADVQSYADAAGKAVVAGLAATAGKFFAQIDPPLKANVWDPTTQAACRALTWRFASKAFDGNFDKSTLPPPNCGG